MARSAEPLLAQRPDSDNGRGIEEEDALLTGENTHKRSREATDFVKSRWKQIGLLTWALAATAAVVVLAVLLQNSSKNSGGRHHKHGSAGSGTGKRNLVFMVSDGMGPTSLSLTRSWRQYTDQLPFDETLFLDKHLIGQSRTRSSSSLVTDSAAGATAFSCAAKSYNGAISILPDFSPCGSVMEAAKRAGYTTGLVVTTRITDATPAVFASHVRRREMEDQIARQMIGKTNPVGRAVDLMFGGGRCHFLPNSTSGGPADGCRSDDIDVIAEAEKVGWNYISTKEDFDNLGTSVELPMLGLFAPTDIPYEIDRRYEDDKYPSLEAMTRTALKALAAASEDADQGFFIMIEGSRIDHAGHANDPAAQVHEVLAYDRAMAAVFDFIKDSETPTLMVATSDHETGGLATARQLHEAYPDYLWYPGVLANASHSASYTARQYFDHLSTKPASDDLPKYLKSLSEDALGIHDLSKDELDLLVKRPELSAYTFADAISRRSQTGWTTHGHSGADVNIYASDFHAAKALRGNHENSEVGEFLRSWLRVEDEVEKITDELRSHLKTLDSEGSWLGEIPADGERLDGQDHLDHYHGDYR